jgi:Ni,Fe-hydrogenase III large subunit/Ni,Fe-hydrogenase III component G
MSTLRERIRAQLGEAAVSCAGHYPADIPVYLVPLDRFNEAARTMRYAEARLVAEWASDETPFGRGFGIYALYNRDNEFLAVKCETPADDPRFPTITRKYVAAWRFERQMQSLMGVIPEGHPDARPWIKHEDWPEAAWPLRKGFDAKSRMPRVPGDYRWIQAGGEGVYEIPVGPVHAGIIEPGHFRFQCHGEQVFHLEIALGYQHRGIERAAVGGPHPATVVQMETVAGDTTIGHITADAMIREGLAGVQAPPRAEAIRAIALELERLANHCGDLGALAGDVGYLPTMSFCGRIRGDFLNMTALLCGSRFGRGLVRPGGTWFGCSAGQAGELLRRLKAAEQDYAGAVDLLWDTPTVLARFEKTGRVGSDAALDLGLVGPAARACGIVRDVRRDHPFGHYRLLQPPVCVEPGGDVLARAMVRWRESRASLEFIHDCLASLPEGDVMAACGEGAGDRLAAALVEGWRGEVCHVAITDSRGRFLHYKVKDPSFHNWSGLALALRNEQISDFPLCNKSFNLSYCGFDL